MGKRWLVSSAVAAASAVVALTVPVAGQSQAPAVKAPPRRQQPRFGRPETPWGHPASRLDERRASASREQPDTFRQDGTDRRKYSANQT